MHEGIEVVNSTKYSEICGAEIIFPADGDQVKLFSMSAHNRSGAPNDLGVVRTLQEAAWKLWKIDASAVPDAIDIDAAIKANTPTAVFAAANDGIMIESEKKIGMLAIRSDVSSGASAVYVIKYFNGTTFATMATPFKLPTAASFKDTALTVIAFPIPLDWEVGTTVAVGGDATKYQLQLIATTQPATAPQIDLVIAGQFLLFREAIADNGYVQVSTPGGLPLKMEAGESFMPYFGTANANNIVEAQYSTV